MPEHYTTAFEFSTGFSVLNQIEKFTADHDDDVS
jgi:hypothetical protein